MPLPGGGKDKSMKYDEILAERSHKKIYRDGDKVVKVFDSNYSTSDILNEALNHARVSETDLPIPEFLDVDKTEDGWAIVTQFIEGKTLAALMEENPSKKKSYLEKFIDLQMRVHSKRAPLLNKLKDKMNRKIEQSPLDATVRYELHTRLESAPKHNKVLHGDFTPGNIIVTPAGKWYVIDWAHATQGNAAADAARTYLRFCLADDKQTADLYLERDCKKSDTARQYVQKWLPIVAASQLVKNKPAEKELLMSWANVVDYE